MNKTLRDQRDAFIEKNFGINMDGEVRRIRRGKFNGNGLLGSISINDLEDVFSACNALMLKERFTVELALENMIEMVEQFIQPCYTKDSLLGIEMSERLRESNQALKSLEDFRSE